MPGKHVKTIFYRLRLIEHRIRIEIQVDITERKLAPVLPDAAFSTAEGSVKLTTCSLQSSLARY